MAEGIRRHPFFYYRGSDHLVDQLLDAPVGVGLPLVSAENAHPVLQLVSGSATEGSQVRYAEVAGVQIDADLLVTNLYRSVLGHGGLKSKVVHMHHFKT